MSDGARNIVVDHVDEANRLSNETHQQGVQPGQVSDESPQRASDGGGQQASTTHPEVVYQVDKLSHAEDDGAPDDCCDEDAAVIAIPDISESGDGACASAVTPRATGGQHLDEASEDSNEQHKKSKVSADESLSAGSKKIQLSGGVLPIVTLFIFGAILGLLSTILAGTFLYDFASETVQDTVLKQGFSQIGALSAQIGPEMAKMDEFIDQTRATIAAEVRDGGQLMDYQDVERRLNKTLMGTAASRILEPHQLAGMGFIACLPPGSTPANAETIFYTSMYYEPLRDGSRGYGYESTLQDPSGYWNNTGRWGRPMEFTNISGVLVPRIYSDPENYDWEEEEYVEGYVNWQDDPADWGRKIKDSIEPWRSSYDGFPYWFMETYQYFEVEGSWFAASTFKYILQLVPVLKEITGDSVNSHIFVYQPVARAIVGTTFDPETNRSAWCYGSADEFFAALEAENDDSSIGTKSEDCLYLPPENSTFPLIRDLFAVTEDKVTWPMLGMDVPDVSKKTKLDGADYFVVTKLLVNREAQRLFVLWVRDAESELAQMRADVIRVVAICCGCILGASLLTMVIAVVGIIKPLDELAEDMHALSALDTERFFTEEKLKSGSIFREVQMLQTRFVAMAMSLHTFSLYVPRDVVKEVLADPSKMTLTMDRRDLAVLFADVAGFTTLSERFDDDQPFFGKIMGTFFRKATQVIHRNGGTIDKFIGDCVMCFWGAPLAVDEPCTRAVCAGLELLQVGPEVSQVFKDHDIHMSLRVGIHFGACLVGNSGSEERLNYTALGDPVNTASRMEGGNKPYKSAMMISREVLTETQRGDRLCYRSVGSMPIRGKVAEVEGFEIFGFTAEPMALPKAVLNNMLGGGLDTMSTHSKTSRNSKNSKKSKRSGSVVQSGDSSSEHREGGGGLDASSERSTVPQDVMDKELERMRQQRTEMVEVNEGCLKIQRKFKMPTRLLTACALNNQAIYFIEEQEDYAKATELYQQCVTLVENELKDLNTKHLPLMRTRMRNFADHIITQIAKLKDAEAEGGAFSRSAVDDEEL